MEKKERLTELIKALVKLPSITESDRENMPAEYLKQRLAELPYYKDYPEHLKYIYTPLEGSPQKLHSLVARIDSAKKTKRTVLMIGHFDVVDVTCYGDDTALAFSPDELTKKMGEGSEKLYGRGVMDMKCGVALETDLIEDFARDREMFDVNLVAAFVGDEENSSAGMRGVLPVLAEMQAEGLDFLAAVNTEPGEAGQSGLVGPMVYLGTLGKIMPSFYLRGSDAHVGNCYAGYSAVLAAAKVVTIAECAPELADPLHGSSQPSWICLDMSAMRGVYSVTVPDRSYVYFNCFTTTNTPAMLMKQMRAVAERALKETSAQVESTYRAALKAGYTGAAFSPAPPKVYSLQQITAKARENNGPKFDAELKEFLAALPEGDMRARGIKIIDKIADLSGAEPPYAVCFFLPPWMPVRTDFTDAPRDRALIDVARCVESELREKHGMEMTEIEFFAGLCDLSYAGGKVSAEDAEAYAENMPGWGAIYSIPLREMQGLGMPVINLGPSGENAHKKNEFLHTGYSLEILPELLRSMVRKISEKVE